MPSKPPSKRGRGRPLKEGNPLTERVAVMLDKPTAKALSKRGNQAAFVRDAIKRALSQMKTRKSKRSGKPKRTGHSRRVK